MFHQVISDLRTSVNNSGRREKKKTSSSTSMSATAAGGSGGCSHEVNSSSYRTFSETPDIFKALPTGNYYYSFSEDDEAIKTIGVLEFGEQEGEVRINPLLLPTVSPSSSHMHSCPGSIACCSQTSDPLPATADVSLAHFSRLPFLGTCPDNIIGVSPGTSLMPAVDLPAVTDVAAASEACNRSVCTSSLPDPPDGHRMHQHEAEQHSPLFTDLKVTLGLEEEEMWTQFQGSVASSLRKKYLCRTSELDKYTGSRDGTRSWDKNCLSFLISRMIPSRRVFGTESRYTDSDCLAAGKYSGQEEGNSSDVAVEAAVVVMGSNSSRNKRSNSLCLTSLVIVFVVFLLTFGAVTFGKLLRIDNLWRKYLDDDSSIHFRELKDSWWQEAIFYEIFPASFRDSDSDGFGDLNGIREKMSYIKDLGVTGIRLNSIFTAMDYPYQYDHVTDFKSVDPHIGSIHDFQSLVHHLHQHRLTIIIDINAAVTSDQHVWATHWLSNKSSAYSSFYVINGENVSQHTCFSLSLSFFFFPKPLAKLSPLFPIVFASLSVFVCDLFTITIRLSLSRNDHWS